MPVHLDHTIIHATDRFASARFVTELLGAPAPVPNGPFAAIPLEDGLTLDYADFIVKPEEITYQHLALRVSEEEFDKIFARVTERELPYWADPSHKEPQRINHRRGGRGLYVDDPDGHSIEFLTYYDGPAELSDGSAG